MLWTLLIFILISILTLFTVDIVMLLILILTLLIVILLLLILLLIIDLTTNELQLVDLINGIRRSGWGCMFCMLITYPQH